MAIVSVTERPIECKLCSSPKVGANLDFTVGEGGETFLCHECNTYMVLEIPVHITARVNNRKCQHCETIGEITTEGGEEWCVACGLDPSEELESTDISILWKPNSEIRRILNEGKSGLDPEKRMGKFLRTLCGPHCNFANQCDQTVKNLVTCFQEYRRGYEGEDEMSKKSRKRCREEKARQHLSTYKEKPKQARVQCAKSGWFERHIVDGTYHTKQAGDKES